METILEQQRRKHEERERLLDAMVKETLQPAKSVSCIVVPGAETVMNELPFATTTGVLPCDYVHQL